MICIPIVATTMAGALSDIAKACKLNPDFLELRLDYIKNDLDIAALVKASSVPCIATCRPVREGGKFVGNDKTRLKILARAAGEGCAYIDIEYNCLPDLPDHGNAKVIASYHDFGETPEDLADIVKRIDALPCDIVKFSTYANHLRDNIRVWDMIRLCKKPAIALCMGELGEISRVLGPRMGSFLTFGSLERGSESAPGQLTAAELAHVYRVNSIKPDTDLYAVVGNPIAHSMSPEVHNASFQHLGMNAAYLRFRVFNLEEFLELFEFLQLKGISVTIPHKNAALKLCKTVNQLAEKIGSVNTLTRDPGGWRGNNTDCTAALDSIRSAALRAGLKLEGARALLIGGGGAAKALAYGLVEAGCKLTVANRTRAKAESLAHELSAEIIDLDSAHLQTFDVVANSTSVGMYPYMDETPVDKEIFHSGMVVFDAVYNPRETRMLREATLKGAETASGLEMFVGQAARQFEIWTGKKAPVEVMQAVAEKNLAYISRAE